MCTAGPKPLWHSYRGSDTAPVLCGTAPAGELSEVRRAEDRVEEAIAVFRGRYLTVGKFENVPYPGIEPLLRTLKEQGHRLYVATSKPESTAVEILNKFELSQYFTRICGASMDSGRDSKEAVIAYLLELEGRTQKTVMVGDTAFDVIGAAAHKIPTIGVSWGYGDVDEMLEAGACAIADTPEELGRFLMQEAEKA